MANTWEISATGLPVCFSHGRVVVAITVMPYFFLCAPAWSKAPWASNASFSEVLVISGWCGVRARLLQTGWLTDLKTKLAKHLSLRERQGTKSQPRGLLDSLQ